MNSSIPSLVTKKAQKLIDSYGQCLELMGEKDGIYYYRFCFPEESLTGFPYVFLYNPQVEDVFMIKGFRAVDIISEFNNINH